MNSEAIFTFRDRPFVTDLMPLGNFVLNFQKPTHMQTKMYHIEIACLGCIIFGKTFQNVNT